jgi:hypothetical protein
VNGVLKRFSKSALVFVVAFASVWCLSVCGLPNFGDTEMPCHHQDRDGGNTSSPSHGCGDALLAQPSSDGHAPQFATFSVGGFSAGLSLAALSPLVEPGVLPFRAALRPPPVLRV